MNIHWHAGQTHVHVERNRPPQTGTLSFTVHGAGHGEGGTNTVSYSLVINQASQTITIGTLPIAHLWRRDVHALSGDLQPHRD